MSVKNQPASGGEWLDVWHVNPSVNRDYDFIDGLRGIAILMVLCCHHFYVNPNSGSGVLFMGEFFNSLGHGVSLFFALSGFLISWPFWKNKISGKDFNIRRYAERRFWKIYPPLVLSIVLFTPVYIYLSHDWRYLWTAMQWLMGYAFVFPVSGNLNPVMWSLVIEIQYYAVLPILFASLRSVSHRVSLWMLPSLFLIIPIAYQIYTGKSPTIHPEINANFPSALYAFAFGILIAGLDCMGKMKKRFADIGFLGFIIWPLALVTLAWMRFQHSTSLWLHWVEQMAEMTASACLLTYVANPQHAIARLLCAPWLRWCGIISYEWYLIHQPLVLWSRDFFGPANGNVLKFVLMIGVPFMVSTVFAAFIYRCFSMPLLKWARGSYASAHS